MNEAKKAMLAFLIVLVLLVVGVYGYYKFETNGTLRKNEEVTLKVEAGSSNSAVAQQLKEEKVIGSTLLFRFFLMDHDYTFQYGEFTLNKHSSYEEICEILSTQQVVITTTEFTIPEGSETREIINILVDTGVGTFDEIAKVINYDEFDYDFIKGLTFDENTYRLEGYLFPDTYEIYTDESPHDVIDRLLDNFDAKTKLMRQDAAADGKNFHDIVKMASIVEREAMDSDEFPIVAGVFYNRLKDEMLLESCATVQYILQERKPILDEEDTKIDNPFNTYIYPGLTPNPISNPGIEALRAASYPAETEYYFFVATNDGTHLFAETYEGHLRNIDKVNAETAEIEDNEE